MIKNGNITMDSIMSSKTEKHPNNFNSTIQPVTNHLAYGSVSAAGKQEKDMNTRNYRNKSIENTADKFHEGNYYHKRGGSTIVQGGNNSMVVANNSMVVASSHPSSQNKMA
jgi:hypothetical protein